MSGAGNGLRKEELRDLFDDVNRLYIVPSYLAREDKNLKVLSPVNLLNMLSNKSKSHGQAAALDNDLRQIIKQHLADADTVLGLTAGGPGSLDEWLRHQFQT